MAALMGCGRAGGGGPKMTTSDMVGSYLYRCIEFRLGTPLLWSQAFCRTTGTRSKPTTTASPGLHNLN
eukprot:765251-Hanusia_phi.AAC.5